MEEIDLGSTRVSDTGLKQLASSAAHLRLVKLAHQNYNLWVDGLYTEDGLKQLQLMRPDLQIKFLT